MATFQIVAQSLRNGEPLSATLHQNLLDRLFYHSVMHTSTSKALKGSNPIRAADPIDAITSYEFMFYACAVVAVFQLVEVSTSVMC